MKKKKKTIYTEFSFKHLKLYFGKLLITIVFSMIFNSRRLTFANINFFDFDIVGFFNYV